MDNYSWLLIGRLMDRYDSLQTVLSLMEKIYPDNRRIKEMNDQLAQGAELTELLNRSPFERNLGFFVRYLPLSKAIDVSYEMARQLKDIRKKASDKIAYPLTLLALAMVILVLFTQLVMPTMLTSLQLENQRTVLLQGLFGVMSIMQYVMLGLTGLAVILYIYIMRKGRQNYFWLFLHRFHLDKTIRMLATYQLVINLQILLKSGISLDRAIEILRFRDEKSWVSLLAYHLHDLLSQGIELEGSIQNEFFDQQFHSICLIGLEQGDFNSALLDYKSIMEMKLAHFLDRLGRWIQLICYLFVAGVILLAYQILMLPLELLEGL